MRRDGGRAILVALAFVVAAAAPAPPAAFANESAAGSKADPVRAITSQLICPCSCGEVLSGCTCDTGISLKGYVADEIKAGKGKEAIEAALVAKYGEVILGAPKAKGFNLIVWVAPFIATAFGFGIASLVLARWVQRKRAAAATAGGPGAPAAGGTPSIDASMEALRARAEAEIREMKG
jgi:cytochrome c-type biogenesis protein CcmH/NrfF